MEATRRGFFATLAALPFVFKLPKATGPAVPVVPAPVARSGVVRWPRDAAAGETVTLTINSPFGLWTRSEMDRSVDEAVELLRRERT